MIGSVQTVVICTAPLNPCPLANQVTTTAYLIDATQSSQIEMMLVQSGIDWDTVGLSFGLGLLMYAVGAGIGLIINVVRNARRI